MSNQRKTNLQGVSTVFMAILLWGVLPLYWKQLNGVPPDQILANRIIWSFVFVLGILIFQRNIRKLFAELKNKQSRVLLISGIIISLNWFTYIYAVNSNQIIEASLGYYINPLLTIFLGRVVLKEKLDYLQLTAVMLAAIGVGIITLSYGRVPIIALILAFSFSMYSLVKKRVKTEVTVGLAIETLAVIPVAVGYLWILGSRHQLAYSSISVAEVFFILGTGIITAIPLLLFSYGAKKIPLTTVGFIQYLAPTISLLLGVFVYKEPFTIIHVITFVFIWTALVIYSFSQFRYFSTLRRSIPTCVPLTINKDYNQIND